MTDTVPSNPATRAVASFAIPNEGTAAVLSAITTRAPTAPVFVYERLDPATRTPKTTWIGLSAHVDEPEARGADAFSALREATREPGRTVLGFVGYPDEGEPDQVTTSAPRAVLAAAAELVVLNHDSGAGTVSRIAAAPAPDDTGLAPEDWAVILAAGIDDSADGSTDGEARTGDDGAFGWTAATPPAAFAASVAAAQQGLDGPGDGVVLSVRLFSPIVSDPLTSYRSLRALNPSTCMFLLRHGSFAVWGATSLSMVEVDDGHLLAETDGATHAVPGPEPERPYVWTPSAKEVDEYDVVVNTLRADLDAVSQPGSMRLTREHEQRRFFGLLHLFAEMQADAATDTDEVDVVRALYPHGAAVGHPRAWAQATIAALEPVPRGPYAGVIGVFGDGTADAACVSRSAWTTGDGSVVHAGAKIVAGSCADEEYEECVLKTLALRRSARPQP